MRMYRGARPVIRTPHSRRNALKVLTAVLILALSLTAFVLSDSDEGDAGVGDTFDVDVLTFTVLDGSNHVSVKLKDPLSTADIIEIPGTVQNGTDTYTVTEIAENGFKDNTSITKVAVPSTVLKIGDHAFDGCTNLNAVADALPLEYTALEYIQSTGGQYIQTKYGFSPTDEVTVKTKVTKTGSNIYLVGFYPWNYESRFAMGGTDNPNYYAAVFGSGFITYSPNLRPTGIITTETYADHKFTLVEENGTVHTANAGSATFGAETPKLILFYGVDSSTAGAIYSWQHSKVIGGNLTLVEDLVPCIRQSDDAIGMYDRVSGEFYANSGSGTFVAGPSLLPVGTVSKKTSCVSLSHVTTIGDYAFSGCISLVSAKLDKVTSTGSHMFDGCTSLKFIGFDSLVNVGAGTFMGSGVEEVTTDNQYKASEYRPVSSLVPEGYTALEYIGSTGSQAIDTGIVPTLDYWVEVVAIKEVGHSLFGAGAENFTLTGAGSDHYAYIGEGAPKTFSGSIDSSLPHVWGIKDRRAYCDDQQTSKSTYTSAPTCSLALFCRHTSASASYSDGGTHTIYSVSIRDGFGNLVFEGIPCKSPAGVVGMYDTVGKRFLTNSGSGSFVEGPAINTGNLPEKTTVYLPLAESIGDSAFEGCTGLAKANFGKVVSVGERAFKGCTKLQNLGDETDELPIGYTQVEYLESSGKQYIDTSIVPSATNSRFVLSFMMTKNNVSAGIRSMYIASGMWVGVFKHNTDSWISCSRYNSGFKSIQYENNVLYEADIKFREYTKINNTEIISGSFSEPTTQASFHLFATYNTNDGVVDCISDGMRVYSLCVYNDAGVCTMKLIPCIRQTDNATGMYDTVSNKFFGKSGSHEFITGYQFCDISLPSVKTIGASAFEGDTGLETVDLPVVTDMGDSAFKGCTSLEIVDLSALTSVADHAFEGCVKLKEVDLEHATSVGESSFEGCEAIIAVTSESRKSRLPEGYTKLEYIQSSGTQYIMSEISAQNIYGFSIKYEITGTTSNAYNFNGIWGTNYSSYDSRVSLNTSSFNVALAMYGVGTKVGDTVSLNEPFTMEYKKSGAYFNGQPVQDYVYVSKHDSSFNRPVAIFGVSRAIDAAEYFSVGKLYYFVVYDNDEKIIGDFVPCADPSNNIGLYDLANGKFYKSANSVSFSPGPEVDTSIRAPLLQTIGDSAFKGCINLKSVDCTAITDIGDYSFSNCPNLESVKLSSTDDVTIGEHSFDSSSKQTASGLKLTGKIVEIEAGAFKDSLLCSINDDDGKIKLNDIRHEGLADHSFQNMDGITTFTSSSLAMIKEGTFQGSSVVTVNAPGVTSIYDSAFENCVNLVNVTFATDKSCILAGTNSFKGAGTSGTGLVVVAQLTSTGSGYAFEGARINTIGLTSGGTAGSVQLDYLKTFAEGTFLQAIGLVSFSSTSTSFTSVGADAFRKTGLVTFTASSVTDVGKRAFYDCDSLGSVTVSSTFKVSVGEEVFRYSSPTNGYQVIGNIETIGDSAFRESTVKSINGNADASVVLQELVEIGNYAFYGTNNISGIIAQKCITIGDHAFEACTALNYFDTSPTLDSMEHAGLLRMLNGFSIGEYAFSKTNINRIALDGPLASSQMVIKKGAFSGINGITEVFIPEGVKTINAMIFDGCINLTKVHVPYSVTSVDTTAFFNTAVSSSLNLYFVSDSDRITFTCSDTSKKPTSTVQVYSKWDNVTTSAVIKSTLTYLGHQVARASVQILYYGDDTVEQLYALDGIDFKLPYPLSSGTRVSSDYFGIAQADGSKGLTSTKKFLSVGKESAETFTVYLTKDSGSYFDTVVLWTKERVDNTPTSQWMDSFTLKVDNTKKDPAESAAHDITVDGVTYALSIDGGWSNFESTSYEYGDQISYPILTATSAASQVLHNFNYISSLSKVTYADSGTVKSRVFFVDDEYTVEDRPMPISVTWICNNTTVRTDDAVEYKSYIESFTPTNIPDGMAFKYWTVTSGTVFGNITSFGGDLSDQHTQAGRTSLIITAQFKTVGYNVNIYDANGDRIASYQPFGEYTITKQSQNNLLIKWDGETGKYTSLPIFDFGYTFSKYVVGEYNNAAHIEPDERGSISDLASTAKFTKNINIYIEKTGQQYKVTYVSAYGDQPGPANIVIDGVSRPTGYEQSYYFLGISSKTVTVADDSLYVYVGYKIGDNQYQGNVVLDQKTFSTGINVTVILMYGDMSYKVGYNFDDDAGNYVEYNSRYTVGNNVNISDSIRSQIKSKYGYELSSPVGTPVVWTYNYGGTDYYIEGLNFSFTAEMKTLAESNTVHPNTFELKAVWTPAHIVVQYTTGTEGKWVAFLQSEYPSTTKNWSATVTVGQADFDATGRCSDSALIGTALIPTLTNVAWPGLTFTGDWEVYKKNGDSVTFDATNGLLIDSSSKLKQYDMDTEDGDSVYIIYISPVFKKIQYTVNYDLEGKGMAKDDRKYVVGDRITLLTKDDFSYEYKDHSFYTWSLNSVHMGQYLDITQDSIVDADDTVFKFVVVWTQTMYMISFDLNGGEGTTPQMIGPALPSTSITNWPSYKSFTKEGYTCVGWSVGGKVLTTTPAHISDLTFGSNSKGEILAKLSWTPTNYDVICNTDGGNISQKYLVGYHDMDLTVPVPTKPGYTFLGWKSTDAAEGAQYKLGDNYYAWMKDEVTGEYPVANSEHFKNLAVSGGTVNLVAEWRPVEYTVEYNLNGGSGTIPPSMLISVDEQFTSIVTDFSGFTMSGYEPRGWSINGTDIILPTTTFDTTMARYSDTNKVITMYLLWSSARYNIILQEDNGTTDKNLEAYYGISCDVGVPMKAGWEFIGWIADDPTKLNLSSAQCSPDDKAWYGWSGDLTTCRYFKSLSNVADTQIVLKAQWNKDKYILTFDLAGGSGDIPSDITATVGDAIADLPDTTGITKTGYKPLGWTIDGDVVISNGDQFTSTMSMYANSSRILSVAIKWEPISYVVEINDGRTASELTVNYGDTLSLGKPVKSGYVFSGWMADSEISSRSMYSSDGQSWFVWDGNLTSYTNFKNLSVDNGSHVKVVAVHTLEEYALSFDINGGTGDVPSDIILRIGDTISNLPSTAGITRSGYHSMGWTIDGNSILTSNTEFTPALARYADENRTVTVTLVWTPIQYNVEYTDATQTYTQSVYYEDSLNIGMPMNEGYVFAGWSHTDGELSATAMSSRDNVSWVLWDGSPNVAMYYKNLSVIDGASVGITAVWKFDSFTIKYNANGGVGTVPVDTTVYTVDSDVQLATEVSISRPGYEFSGWSYDRNASSPVEINKFTLDYVSMTDEYNQLTLYAVWSIGFYKVTMNIGDAEPSDVPSGWVKTGIGLYQKQYENGYPVVDLLSEWDGISFSLDGKYFKGWSYNGTKVISDTTISAIFQDTSPTYIYILLGLIVLIAIVVFFLTRIERR